MLWSPTATQWRGPWGQTDGPRVLECLWTMGGGLVGKGLSLMVEFAKPLGLVWEESPVSGEVGGGWPGLGYRERARRARLGADEAEAQPRAMALAQARGWGGLGGEGLPQGQALRRPAGTQMDGMGGDPPSQAPHPRWPSWGGGGDGAREPGLGGTRCPQLSVFGAAQRKTFSRWEVPHMATGDPPRR